MPATINGTSGFGGNLTGNVTGNADTATASTTATKLSTTTGDAPTYACRAWVNFDGTTVTNVGGEDRCTIRQSGNVAKVVRNATADYTITFTTAMPDVDYCVVAASRTSTATAKGFCSPVTYNTADVRILASGEISSGGLNYIGANSNVNHNIVNVAIFR